MNVLIISFHFPPSSAIGAARSGALCDALRTRGHDVKVVTAAQGDVSRVLDDEVVQMPWFDFARFAMVRNQNIQPTTEMDTRSLNETQLAPRSLASVIADRNLDWLSALRAPGSWPRRRAADFRSRHFRFTDRQQGWARPARRAGLALAEKTQFDLIVAIGPPVSAYVAAAKVAARLGIPWAADYRDLWTASTHYRQPNWFRRLDESREKRLLGSAALVTTVSAPLAADMSSAFGVPCEVVRNGYERHPLVASPDREPLGGALLNLAYVGDAFYGGRRSPELVFRAARQLGLSAQQIQFHFLGTDIEFVGGLAATVGVSDLVRYHDPVDRSDSLAFQSRADALLHLAFYTADDLGSYSGKVFEYLAACRPILFTGHPMNIAADLIRDTGRGFIASNKAEAAAAISFMVSQKRDCSLLPDLPEAPWEFSREAQCNRMIDLLESVVSDAHREV